MAGYLMPGMVEQLVEPGMLPEVQLSRSGNEIAGTTTLIFGFTVARLSFLQESISCWLKSGRPSVELGRLMHPAINPPNTSRAARFANFMDRLECSTSRLKKGFHDCWSSGMMINGSVLKGVAHFSGNSYKCPSFRTSASEFRPPPLRITPMFSIEMSRRGMPESWDHTQSGGKHQLIG